MATKPDLLDTSIVARPEVDPFIALIERLSANPAASVDTIERLVALYERTEAKKAESAFNAAMAEAQREMRPVAADAYNPQTKSKYASYEALDEALRPIYTKHGFALSFNTGEAPGVDTVRMLCDVTHLAGHGKPYKLDMPADGKGAKGGDVMTKTHATGSAISYGMRYLLKMIFNIAVDDDDDGNKAGQTRSEVKAPDGFEAWWGVLEGLADQGLPAVTKAFNDSKEEFRKHLMATNRRGWEALKTAAAKTTKR